MSRADFYFCKSNQKTFPFGILVDISFEVWIKKVTFAELKNTRAGFSELTLY